MAQRTKLWSQLSGPKFRSLHLCKADAAAYNLDLKVTFGKQEAVMENHWKVQPCSHSCEQETLSKTRWKERTHT